MWNNISGFIPECCIPMFSASSYDTKYYIWYIGTTQCILKWVHTKTTGMHTLLNLIFSLYCWQIAVFKHTFAMPECTETTMSMLHKSQPIHKDTHVIMYTSEHLNFLTCWSCMEATPLSHNLIHENEKKKAAHLAQLTQGPWLSIMTRKYTM